MRSQSEQSYRLRINRVVMHIQQHLDADLDGAVLAGIAAMSRFHFHRVFAAMTGVTPSAYVQRVRVAAAVQALRASRAPVGRIALDCGFESGASLAKALRREYGLSPSAARSALLDTRIGLGTHATPHTPQPRRRTMLEPTLHDLPARALLCATERGAVANDLTAASQRAFDRLFPAAERLGVAQRSTACLAICPDEMKSPDDPDMRFIAALAYDGPAPDVSATPGIECRTLAGGRYAVFRHVGPYNTLWQTWVAIYRDWVPRSTLALRDEPPFELYVSDASKEKPERLITDIHVPVEG